MARATIALPDELMARLKAEAARRNLPGYGGLIEEATEQYLQRERVRQAIDRAPRLSEAEGRSLQRHLAARRWR
jgi:predicted transcriptional regulator